MIQTKEIIEGKTWQQVSKDVYSIYKFLKSNSDKTEVILTTTSAKSLITVVLGTWLSNKIFSFYTEKQVKVNKNTIVLTDECLTKIFSQSYMHDFNLLPDIVSIWNEICDKSKYSNAIAMLINTSGSTGTPKSVAISFKSVVHHVNYMANRFNLTATTKELVILPISSTAILFSQLLPVAISKGTLQITQIPLNIPCLTQQFNKNYDFMGITPTILRVLDKAGYNWKFTGVKSIAVGGEEIDFAYLKHTNELLNRNVFYPMYGLTETLGVFCMGGPNDNMCPFGSVGKAYPEWNIRIMKGELQVKSEYLALGYFSDDSRLSALKLTQDGWFQTGDIAKIDSKGYIYILGREKNVIISGGVNIYPEEIETVLERMPSVKHAFVEKRKNRVLGEVPVVKVVMNENFEFVEKDLYEFAKKNLDTLKIPRSFEKFTDNVSLIGLGKAGRKKHDK